MNAHILVVEDDDDINHLLAEILRRSRYDVSQAYSGTEAKLLLEHNRFDLVLLDLMLPGMTGEELVPLIRKTSPVPIIILSAKESAEVKIDVLRAGADDYVTKPFNEGELLARVEAALRRAGAQGQNSGGALVYKDIRMDREARSVMVGDRSVSLTGREFDILELLMGNPKKVFTKANLFQSIWNDEFLGDDNTVNVHISKLRSKLGDKYIQTVWGIGFKMQE